MTESGVAARTASARVRRRRRQPLASKVIVVSLAVAAGVGGALAGTHPTGTAGIDELYAAAFAVLVTVACSLASRATWLLLTVVAVAMSRNWLLIPAVADLGIAFSSAFSRRRTRRVGALVGALGSQVILRWPNVGFQGLTLIAGAVAVIPCFVSAYRHLGRRDRRRVRWGVGLGAALVVIFSVPVAIGGLLARHSVSGGIADTRAALVSAENGQQSTANEQLNAATHTFSHAHSLTGAWWSLGGRLVPIVAQQGHAMGDATSAARHLTTVATAEQAEVNLKQLRLDNGQIDLGRVEALARPLAQLNAQLAGASTQLHGVASPWLVEPVHSRLVSLTSEVAKARRSTHLAAETVGIAPAVLGGHGVRNYFVALDTPAETRGLGGFIGAYGLLTVDNGKITLSRSGHVATDLNAGIANGARHITGPPGYLARYGGFMPNDNFQDLTYSPDLPTVAQVIAQMYPQSGGVPIDGVLAIDPYGLAALLKLTGPVVVPGYSPPLTSANVAETLIQTQYLQSTGTSQAELNRVDEDQAALSQAFHQLLAQPLPSPRVVSTDVDPMVREGHLLFWSLHPAEQSLLGQIGLAGTFPSANGGDLLAVTTQNAANNKIDSYLTRTINDQVTYDPANGAEASTVTISLHNGASATMPPDISGSYVGSGLPPGTNRTWLSLYSPLLLTSASREGTSIQVSSNDELGVHAYSAYVNIPPGGTVTVVAHLTGAVMAGSYRLALHQQPLVNPDRDTTIRVQSTAGWTTRGADSWAPTDALDQAQAFRFAKIG